VFDEADFVATTMGNPDEISLDPEPQPPRQGQAQRLSHQIQPNLPASALANAKVSTEIVTPSKPESSWTGPDLSRPQQLMAQQLSVTGNDTTTQKTPTAYPRPQHVQQQNNMAPPQPQSRNSQEANANGQSGSNVPPAAGFYSAKAVDILRENPNAAPKFDPHAESPSIRKTAGFDHTKSIPVSRPMLTGASPATNNTRDFINPTADVNRRIGAPGGSVIGSPMGRGPSTSSYRPLTRPAGVGNNGATPNPTLKRPPLNDVTNATGADTPTSVVGPNDPKRPRVMNGGERPTPTLP
jgi:DNA repair and recombination protein RAD52